MCSAEFRDVIKVSPVELFIRMHSSMNTSFVSGTLELEVTRGSCSSWTKWPSSYENRPKNPPIKGNCEVFGTIWEDMVSDKNDHIEDMSSSHDSPCCCSETLSFDSVECVILNDALEGSPIIDQFPGEEAEFNNMNSLPRWKSKSQIVTGDDEVGINFWWSFNGLSSFGVSRGSMLILRRSISTEPGSS